MSFMEFSVTYSEEKTNNTERRRKTPVNYLIILLKVVAPLTNTGWSHTHTHFIVNDIDLPNKKTKN